MLSWNIFSHRTAVKPLINSPIFLLTLDGDSGLLFAAGGMTHVVNAQRVRDLVTLLQLGAPLKMLTLVNAVGEEQELI